MNLIQLFVLFTGLLSSVCLGEPTKLLLGVDADSYYQSSPSYAQIKKFLKDALNKKQIEVEFIEMPSARITVSVNSGSIDADPLASESEIARLPSVIAIPFPYYKFKMATIYKKSRSTSVPEPTMSRKICGPRWTQTPLKKIYEARKLEFIPLDEYQQCLKMVSHDRIAFGAISTLILGDLRHNKAPNLEGLEVADDLIYSVDLFMVLNKKHIALVPVIEQALREQVKLRGEYPLISGQLGIK